jgi:hypothetical protein
MSFTLSENERKALVNAEKKFVNWRRSEAELDAEFGSYKDWCTAVAPSSSEYGIELPKILPGAPGNHLGHVWVRMSAEAWKEALSKEPAACNGRFSDALAAFAVDRRHLPTVGADLIESEIKNWRMVRMPTSREDNAAD